MDVVMFVFIAVVVLGAVRAQLGGNMLNGGWGGNGLGRIGNTAGSFGLGRIGNTAGSFGLGGIGNTAGAFWGGNTRGLGVRNQNTPQYITCIGKNTAGDQMRVTIQDGQNQRQNFFNPWNQNQNQQIKLEARIMISPNSQTSGQFQMVITENSRVEDGCLGQYLGRIIDNRPWWISTPNQETGVIGRPFFLSPGHVASTSEIVEGFNSIFDANGRGIALCPATSIRNGMCVDDPGAMIPMCCKAGLDRIPATTPIPQQQQTQFGQSTGFSNINTMGTMMPTAGTGLPTNPATLTGQTGGGDLSSLFGTGRR
ncbi:uncharacterized protein LOC121376530 isoform X2 [Gigantopelta aegis]|uniref:uncharacterized protein LOC121376530 isoform X2 n=1 Tax=Gigantopelta aegis TaxID=1735272 RepID=UPI001B88E5FF|nr:uncharacterized protein LOC121376530 isoform X2 [Gigantopelta aegis]